MTECHVAIYLRVSTDQQDLARQVEACRRLAEQHFPALPIVEYREEGVSAFKHSIFDRAKSGRMIEEILAGRISGVVTDTQDRLSRGRQSELWAFIDICNDNDVTLVSVETNGPVDTDSEIGEVMLAFRGAMARSEGVKRRHRIRSSFEEMTSQGYWPNGVPPYGYKIVGPKRQRTLLPTTQAAFVRIAFDLYASGEWSQNRIAKWMAEQDPSRSGHRQNVRDDILSNPAYIGKQRRLGEVIDSRHEGIVSEEVWEAVQARLASIEPPPAHVQPFGSRLMRCECGGRLLFQRDKRGEQYGGAYGYYLCNTCPRRHVSEYIEASIMLAFMGTAWTLDNELRNPSFEPGSTREEVEALRSSIDTAERGVEALTEAVAAGSKAATPRLVEKEAELDGLRSLLAKREATSDEIRTDWRRVYDKIRSFNVIDWDDYPETREQGRIEAYFHHAWCLATWQTKKQLTDGLLDRVTVESERVLLHFNSVGFANPIPVPLVSGNRHKPISRDLRAIGLGSGGTSPAALSPSPS